VRPSASTACSVAVGQRLGPHNVGEPISAKTSASARSSLMNNRTIETEYRRFRRGKAKLAILVDIHPRDLANGCLDVLGKPCRAFQVARLLRI
jgi:hypothetical protein